MSDHLSRHIKELEDELERLKALQASVSANKTNPPERTWDCDHKLTKHQVERYSRQLVLPSFGPQAQTKLSRGRVLVVGAGGLGSTALLYLSAAGVGKIGIADIDKVEMSNLHRQIIHNESAVGMDKTASAQRRCQSINSDIDFEIHPGLSPENAVEIVSEYDVVVDASDNAQTRYLISDACVVSEKPLVSGAAIGTDGQLTVYNYGPDGPCYRCLFPKAPPVAACCSCSEAGVLGPVPGTIGVLQSMEAIKIISEVGSVLSRRLLLVDFLGSEFRTVKIRGKDPSCVACGTQPTITIETLASYDYNGFTGQLDHSAAKCGLKLAAESHRITPSELQRLMNFADKRSLVTIDVRPEQEFEICRLKGALSYPIQKFDKVLPSLVEELKGKKAVIVCRRGNDSQIAAEKLRASGVEDVVDVKGGLEGWARDIDPADISRIHRLIFSKTAATKYLLLRVTDHRATDKESIKYRVNSVHKE